MITRVGQQAIPNMIIASQRNYHACLLVDKVLSFSIIVKKDSFLPSVKFFNDRSVFYQPNYFNALLFAENFLC